MNSISKAKGRTSFEVLFPQYDKHSIDFGENICKILKPEYP
jgi:hypothetical protein